MHSVKVNPITLFNARLTGSKRILVLGPLDIEVKKLRERLKAVIPDCIILVDGGLRHRQHLSKQLQKIAISVGDGDSKKNTHEELDIKLPPQKDYSDLKFVLSALTKTKDSIEKVEFLGFSTQFKEKRADHLLINIGEISIFMKKLHIPVALDDRFLFLPAGKNSIYYKGLFSLLCFKVTQVKIKGDCDYHLDDWTKMAPLSSLGLSNVGRGKIIIFAKAPVLIYFAGESFK